MDINVNYWAVLWAALSSLAVGMVWYSKPALGDEWAKLVKLNIKQQVKGAPFAIFQAGVAGLLTAFVLAHLIAIVNGFFANDLLTDALNTSFWVWLGFVATTIITHNAFEQRRKKLTLITLGHEFVTFMVMGAVIGFFS